jgi:ubiquinone/menaquinone biosynthesis C-methylase UbiE
VVEIDWKALSRVIDVFSSEAYTPVIHHFYNWMVDRMDDRDLEPKTILDLGCGTALLSAKLVDWYPDATITLVDDNEAMLSVARQRLGDVEQVSIVQASARATLAELQPGAIEMLILCRIWYALPEPEQVAARAMEILAPEGLVFLFDFTRTFDLDQLDAIYSEREPERWPHCRVAMVDFNEGVADERYRLYSEAEITAQWQAAGAELVAYESYEPHFSVHRMCFKKA